MATTRARLRDDSPVIFHESLAPVFYSVTIAPLDEWTQRRKTSAPRRSPSAYEESRHPMRKAAAESTPLLRQPADLGRKPSLSRHVGKGL